MTWAGQHGLKVDLTEVEAEVAALAGKIKAPIILERLRLACRGVN